MLTELSPVKSRSSIMNGVKKSQDESENTIIKVIDPMTEYDDDVEFQV